MNSFTDKQKILLVAALEPQLFKEEFSLEDLKNRFDTMYNKVEPEVLKTLLDNLDEHAALSQIQKIKIVFCFDLMHAMKLKSEADILRHFDETYSGITVGLLKILFNAESIDDALVKLQQKLSFIKDDVHITEQPCWYGNGCTDPSCPRVHPDGRVAAKKASSDASKSGSDAKKQNCRYKEKCTDFYCAFNHPAERPQPNPPSEKKVCMFGTNCSDSTCKNHHPDGYVAPCYYFQNSTCSLGDSCKRRHVPRPKPKNNMHSVSHPVEPNANNNTVGVPPSESKEKK